MLNRRDHPSAGQRHLPDICTVPRRSWPVLLDTCTVPRKRLSVLPDICTVPRKRLPVLPGGKFKFRDVYKYDSYSSNLQKPLYKDRSRILAALRTYCIIPAMSLAGYLSQGDI